MVWAIPSFVCWPMVMVIFRTSLQIVAIVKDCKRPFTVSDVDG